MKTWRIVFTLLLGWSVGCFWIDAQTNSVPESVNPKPTFFEEERRLSTPTTEEIKIDKQVRSSEGFEATFLIDALGGVSDPAESAESRGSTYSPNISPGSDSLPLNLGIFARPPR